MTVPEGTPKHIRLADEMAQNLTVIGADVSAGKHIAVEIAHRRDNPDRGYDREADDVLELFFSIEKAAQRLDKVMEELKNGIE